MNNLTLQEIDDILSVSYPTSEKLENFPLGNKLIKLDRMVWTSEMRCIELNVNDSSEKKVHDLIVEYTQPDFEIEKRNKLNLLITEQLKSAGRISKDEIITDVFRNHIEQCMKGLRILLKDPMAMEEFFEEFERGYKPYVHFRERMKLFDHFDKKLLRLVTLYHDIGKVIHRDKHPMLGQHLLESLEDQTRKQLVDLLSVNDENERISDQWFYTFLDIVGHHDLFGTLCTGEASRTAFIEASGMRLRDIGEAKKIIDYIVVVNLADIYGSIGPLPKDRAQMILDDWDSFQSIKESVNPILPFIMHPSDEESQKNLRSLLISKQSWENKLMESEQEPEKTIERIRRITVSGIIYGKETIIIDGQQKYFEKKSRTVLAKKVTSDMIRSALVKELGPELQTFCKDFALVCKLDYTLRFITELCNGWIYERYESITNDNNYRLETLPTTILNVLIRLVRCYSDLTFKKDGGQRRIGLELLDLTRSKEISALVIKLLLDKDRKSEGINWIADETTAWYYV